MNATTITIPYHKTLTLQHVVLDYNGTLAKDGVLKESSKPVLALLCARYEVHVITSDTFGSVQTQMEPFELNIKVLHTDDHTGEKAAYINELSAKHCAAIGNGNNDATMLKNAALGIAIIGDEGCSTTTMMSSDIVCKNIEDALALLLNKKRLIATLRK